MKVSPLVKPLFFALLYLYVSSTTAAESWTGHVSGYVGNKTLAGDKNSEDQDWSTFDELGSIGLVTDFKQESWPMSLTLGVFISGNEEKYTGNNKQEMGTMELQLGIQKYFDIEDSAITPYVALGVGYVSAEIHNTVDGVETKDDDTKAAGWAGAGFIVDINRHFDVGLDIRYSEAELTIFDVESDAGGLTTSVRVGYHF